MPNQFGRGRGGMGPKTMGGGMQSGLRPQMFQPPQQMRGRGQPGRPPMGFKQGRGGHPQRFGALQP